MGTISEDIRRLLEDCELFVSSILQDENLSRHARETRDILLNNFRVVHNKNPQEFPYRSEFRNEDSSDDNRSSSLGRSAHSDDLSVASDYQEDAAPEYRAIDLASPAASPQPCLDDSSPTGCEESCDTGDFQPGQV